MSDNPIAVEECEAGASNNDENIDQIQHLFREFIHQRLEKDQERFEIERREPSTQDDLTDEARRIGLALLQIGDEIELKHKDSLEAAVRNVMQSATYGNYFDFMRYIRTFIAVVSSSASASVATIQNTVRIFIMMFSNRSLAQMVSDSMFGQSLSEKIPEEIKEMDDDAIKMYIDALETGEEYVRHLRLMVVGMFGVGKTSLVQNLLKRDIQNVESTTGIDVYVDHCTIEEGKWKIKEIGDLAGIDYSQRLKRIMLDGQRKKQKHQTEGHTQSGLNQQPEVIYQRESKPMGKKETGEEEIVKMKKTLDFLKEEGDPFLNDFITQVCKAKPLPLIEAETTADDVETTVSIWDFAGQYIYYSSHHFFLSSRSIYLLVMDISKQLSDPVGDSVGFSPVGYQQQDFRCLDAFKFWLNSIHSHSCEATSDTVPTVVLVGTHRNYVSGNDEQKEIYKEKYFNEALESFIDTPVIAHIHPKKFFIDNFNQNDMVFDEIKAEVMNIATQQRYWNEKVPVKWILLERTIEVMKAEGREMIKLEELIEADRLNEYPVNDKQQIILFLKFQHALGSLVYFETADLGEYIILTPQWIVDAFRCFVSHFPEKKPAQLGLWKEYEEMGKLHPDLIDAIIDENEKHTFVQDHKEQVIKYLEHLDVMAKPTVFAEDLVARDQENGGGNETDTGESSNYVASADGDHTARKQIDEDKTGDDNGSSKTVITSDLKRTELDFHLVPCMLKIQPAESAVNEMIQPRNAKVSPVLCFVFIGKFLQPAVFHRMLAACIRKWAISRNDGKFLLFNGLAVFRLDQQTTLTIWLDDYTICARIALYTHKGLGIPSKVCDDVRTFMGNMLSNILGIYKKRGVAAVDNLRFEECVLCDVVDLPAKCWIKATDFLEMDEIKCCSHSSRLPVTRDYALSLWFPGEMKLCETKLDEKLCRIPTERELNALAACIGDEYWAVGILLGIKEKRMQQIREENIYNVRQRIFQVLMEWRKTMKRVSVSVLRRALQAVDGDVLEFDKVFE